MTLKQFIGPDTEIGKQVIPTLYNAIVQAIQNPATTRTKLIFTEWSRLFGQVDGVSSERLQKYLARASSMHDTDYQSYPQAYVFALSTYIAIVAKVCAAHALMNGNEPTTSSNSPVEFLRDVESDRYFQARGIQNMLTTDFFSWYLGDDVAPLLATNLELLITHLDALDFDVTRKSPESVIDLFKGLYMEFTPAPMRHALGEYYTPDWLASHVMKAAGWSTYDSLLDPTCGSGTFLLEAVKRRLEDAAPCNTAGDILAGLYGFDLNPLAVLTARASLVVFLSNYFSATEQTIIPVYLADAINTADPVDGVFTHSILTEKGKKTFAIPYEVAVSSEFYDVMDHLRICIDSDIEAPKIMSALEKVSATVRYLEDDMRDVLKRTIEDLVELHKSHWNGIWCFILFDRIKAGCVKDVDYVIGNPPWVKWSNLPKPYAEFIKPLCERMDIFSEDSWVGGIQSDISTVVTYHALERFVRKNGTLAFLITGTVFKNESSQGFRRWTLHTEGSEEKMRVELVEDYKDLKPFDGVVNWPTLLVIRRNGKPTKYPITYRVFNKSRKSKALPEHLSNSVEMEAIPVPGTDDGPWLVGNRNQLDIWSHLIDAGSPSTCYSARKGITTDANGIYFVTASQSNRADQNQLSITNDPANGRRELPQLTLEVESEYIFPLLRGREIKRFGSTRAENSCVIVPQTGMFGDENLPASSPNLFQYLARFKDVLESRSSYRRFQMNKPFWSVWTVGSYTFAPFKVVWKEMSGANFVASYTGSVMLPNGEQKIVVPDHKVYFIPVETEDEAAYLTAFLKARSVSGAVSAYSSDLSLGTSVVDYLKIPKFNSMNESMTRLSSLGKRLTYSESPVSDEDEEELDKLVKSIVTET